MIGQSINILSNIAMKFGSSISSGKSFLMGLNIGGAIESFMQVIFLYAARLVYAICKWLFYLIDIIFFYIRQLSGLNVDTSSLSSMTSGETDLVFNMLYANSNLVTQILRQLAGLAIVVIIILSIVAIIKTHYDTMNNGAPGDNKKVVKNIFKALLFILITPMICLGGIMMSNVLIKSLYNATNITGSYSLGGSVFSLASTSGNAYRIYAQNGKRIPIYYEFSQQEEYLGQIEKEEITQKSIEYLTSRDNPAYQTHLMFEDESYYVFDELNETSNVALRNEYYLNYDRPANTDATDANNKKITAYREEYFVMADFVDFAVKTSTKFYIKTIEEVLDSAKSVSNSLYTSMKSQYEIDDNGNTITFINNMVGYDDETMQPGASRNVKYTHTKGAIDELYGAVFIITVERTEVVGNISHTYYEPVVNGYRKNSDTAPFESDFIKNGHMVIAKGVFTADHLPTAIKRDKNGTDIICYRDSLKEYDLGDVAGLALLYPEERNQGGFFNTIVQFFKRLFNIKDTEIKFNIDSDAVKITYKKQTDQAAKFVSGNAYMSYLFDRGEFFNPNIESISVNNFYVVTKFNFLIMIVGAWLLLKTCTMTVFKLIQRIYELFLLFIFYPASCAAFPLDNGAGYQQWLSKFTGKLFSTYGLILGINLVLAMAPLVETIQFFSAGEISSVTQLRRMGLLFFNVISYNQMASMLNLTCAVMFQLVAFTLMSSENSSLTKMVKEIMGGEDVTDQNPGAEIARVADTLLKVTTFPAKGLIKVINVVTHPKKSAKGLLSKAMKLAPMSAVVTEVKDKAYQKQKKQEQKAAMNRLEESLGSSSSSKEEIEKNLGEALNAQKVYTSSLDQSKTSSLRKSDKDKASSDDESPSSKNSKEGGSQESQARDMFAGMSDEEVEEEVQKAGKFKSKKVDKFLNGKLKGKKASKYKKFDEMEELGMLELQRRKARKEDIENSLELVDNLKAKGTLTAEEQQALDETESKLTAYNKEILEEQEEYNIAHTRSRRRQQMKQQKAAAKKAAQYEEDKLLFRHKSRGGYKGDQKKALKRYEKDAKKAVKKLDISLYEGKSLAEIDELIKEGILTKGQKTALTAYRDSIERRQNLLEIRNKEYEHSAAKEAQIKISKDEHTITSRKPFGKNKRQKQDQKINGKLDDWQAELESVNQQISDQTQMMTGTDYKRLRKLNERKVALQRKVEAAEVWNQNYSEEGAEYLREKHKAERRQKRQEKRDEFIGLNEHAIDYWQNKIDGDGIVTSEKLEEYKRNVRANRNKRAKRTRRKFGMDKDK